MKRLNLIKWEKENGYKSKYVAKKLGISETSYSLMKNGKTTPTIDLLYKFDAIYGPDINVLELFKEVENEKNR